MIPRFLTAAFVVTVGLAGVASGEGADHGASLKLGSVKLINQEFIITRLGDLVQGKEAAFEVTSSGNTPALSTLSLYLWLEDEGGAQVSAPSKGSAEGAGLHFHATSKAGTNPSRVTLRFRRDGKDERASLPLSGHGHVHSTPHEGVVASLKGPSGEDVGFVELKLHDDKGDLELWLGKDRQMREPFDVPMETSINVSFIDVPGKTVTCKVRNTEKNEDEEGTVNLRQGKTNYFVFPGGSGQDSSWLQGEKFQSVVELSYSLNGKSYKSEEFMLVPHSHTDGHGH